MIKFYYYDKNLLTLQKNFYIMTQIFLKKERKCLTIPKP